MVRTRHNLVIALAVLAVGIFVQSASGAVVSLHFQVGIAPLRSGDADNTTDNAHNYFTGQSGSWNALAFPDVYSNIMSTQPTTGTLLDGTGVDTGVTFSYNTTGGTYSSYNGGGSYRAANIFLSTGTNPSTSTSISWKISGLVPGNAYDLILFGQQGPSNPSRFTVFGNAATLDEEYDGNFFGIIANGAGEITGTHEEIDAFSSWGALQIRGTFVPEPGSASLLILGAAAVLARARRRRQAA